MSVAMHDWQKIIIHPFDELRGVRSPSECEPIMDASAVVPPGGGDVERISPAWRGDCLACEEDDDGAVARKGAGRPPGSHACLAEVMYYSNDATRTTMDCNVGLR